MSAFLFGVIAGMLNGGAFSAIKDTPRLPELAGSIVLLLVSAMISLMTPPSWEYLLGVAFPAPVTVWAILAGQSYQKKMPSIATIVRDGATAVTATAGPALVILGWQHQVSLMTGLLAGATSMCSCAGGLKLLPGPTLVSQGVGVVLLGATCTLTHWFGRDIDHLWGVLISGPLAMVVSTLVSYNKPGWAAHNLRPGNVGKVAISLIVMTVVPAVITVTLTQLMSVITHQ